VARVEAEARRLGVQLDGPQDVEIPHPPHWGGFTLVADSVELWVSRPARIHDRAQWSRERDSDGEWSTWQVQRLQP
jgi:pyridoxamine 5'-phosphate oxidase